MRSFEFGTLCFVGRNLFVSDRRERKRMKDERDILVTAIIAQFDVDALHVWFGDDAGQREIRRNIADLEWICHLCLLIKSQFPFVREFLSDTDVLFRAFR